MKENTQSGSQEIWMELPVEEGAANVPVGLRYLKNLDKLLVAQKEFLAWADNKYAIKNEQDQNVYLAIEESSACAQICCGPTRTFDVKVMDKEDNEVIRLHRDMTFCGLCCIPCCLQKLYVYSPVGNLIGTVEQTGSFFTPKFSIKNENGDTVLKIRGPGIHNLRCCRDAEFQVLSASDRTVVGKITNKWKGLVEEIFTDANSFGVSFPKDLDVNMKAVMIGACFLIDFVYFEKYGG